MRYGYFMMPLHPPGSALADTIEMDLRQIECLERLGYDEVWVGEHFTHEWENIPAPDLFIAAALQRTKRIRLGIGVSCMPNHTPFMLAHRVAQLDHMARGRLLWGVGPGATLGDFEVLGIDPRSGRQREIMREMVDVILDLWDNATPGEYEGTSYHFRVPEPDESFGKRMHLTPYMHPHPPIAVAGASERSESLDVAGERGWLPMSGSLALERVLRSHWDQYAEGAQRVGRQAPRETWRISRTIHVAETTEQARREVLEGAIGRAWREYFLPMTKRTRVIERIKARPEMTDDEVTIDYLMDNLFVVGDPDECARRLNVISESVGGFGMVLAIAHDWEDPAIWERSMRLLAQDVIPQVQST